MFILRSKAKLTDASGEWTQYGVWGEVGVGGRALAASELGRQDHGHHRVWRSLLLVPAAASALCKRCGGRWALAEVWRYAHRQPTQDQFVPRW
jgi:hypothetical protein